MKTQLESPQLAAHIKLLGDLSKKLGKRVRKLNLSDLQVQRIPYDWHDALTPVQPSPDSFIRGFNYAVDGFRFGLRVNDEYVAVDAQGNFGDSVICSFRKNRSQWLGGSTRSPAPWIIQLLYGCMVYIESGRHRRSTLDFLRQSSSRQLYKRLRLSRQESLHIGIGQAELYLQRLSMDAVLEALAVFQDLLALVPPSAEATATDLGQLPTALHRLAPMVRRWGILDDDERERQIGKASTRTLEDLVATVEPCFQEINRYLDSLGNADLPDHAPKLGALAESAAEAQLVLQARKGDLPDV